MNHTDQNARLPHRRRWVGSVRRVHDIVRNGACNRDGVAAIEFALIFPFMLLVFFGIVELEQVVMLDQLVSEASSTITSIVSQYTTISAGTELPGILNASAQIFAPYSAAGAGIVITCIDIDDDGNATVAWSRSMNAAALPPGQKLTLPAGLDTPDTSLLYGQVFYSYSPSFDFLHLGPFKLHSAVYMLPRNAETISLVP